MLLRLSLAFACTTLLVTSCRKKEAPVADAGVRAAAPVAPTTPPTTKKSVATPPPPAAPVAPLPKHQGAPPKGERVTDPEDVEE